MVINGDNIMELPSDTQTWLKKPPVECDDFPERKLHG